LVVIPHKLMQYRYPLPVSGETGFRGASFYP